MPTTLPVAVPLPSVRRPSEVVCCTLLGCQTWKNAPSSLFPVTLCYAINSDVFLLAVPPASQQLMHNATAATSSQLAVVSSVMVRRYFDFLANASHVIWMVSISFSHAQL